MEDDEGAEHRQRDGDQRDEGRLPVEQEHEQHKGDADECFDEHAQEVIDRRLDEARLAELDIGRAHAGGHHALQLRQHRFDLPGDADSVGIGLLLHGQDDARLAVESGIAPLGARSEFDVGHLAQRDAVSLPVGDDEVAQIIDLGRAADVADQNFARLEVDKAAAGIGAELLERVLDRFETDVEARHAARIGHDTVLAHLAADRNDLRDAGHGKNLRPHGEVGEFAQRHGIDRRARHGDQHDLAHDR